jgi:hypothetical protein
MKLLVVGVLSLVTATLLTAALLLGYREDQRVIMRFSGTGIAGKLDVIGAMPDQVLIEDLDGSRTRVTVNHDGTFVARLAPGMYRLGLPNDSRTVIVSVPGGECLDVVLDLRLPKVVLVVPGEGWPVPARA